jgi:hypothetical protein
VSKQTQSWSRSKASTNHVDLASSQEPLTSHSMPESSGSVTPSCAPRTTRADSMASLQGTTSPRLQQRSAPRGRFYSAPEPLPAEAMLEGVVKAFSFLDMDPCPPVEVDAAPISRFARARLDGDHRSVASGSSRHRWI